MVGEMSWKADQADSSAGTEAAGGPEMPRALSLQVNNSPDLHSIRRPQASTPIEAFEPPKIVSCARAGLSNFHLNRSRSRCPSASSLTAGRPAFLAEAASSAEHVGEKAAGATLEGEKRRRGGGGGREEEEGEEEEKRAVVRHALPSFFVTAALPFD
ncbi:hypothetical protein MHYP_G00098250 [Metynnis hypsauchen]